MVVFEIQTSWSLQFVREVILVSRSGTKKSCCASAFFSMTYVRTFATRMVNDDSMNVKILFNRESFSRV